jgi:predicted PhzF superfamily epimerase YddE/YHI9
LPELHVLRVFCDPEGGGGNPLGVFLDGGEVAEGDRQAFAADLGFSETVFVEDAGTGELRIFTPAEELAFAGHPLVGSAWLLARERETVDRLRPPAGEVPVRREAETTFIAGRPEWAPGFEFVQVGSPDEVDRLEGPPPGKDMAGVWAWLDEQAGVVRERVFAADVGIPEDEATGAAAVLLGAQLARPLDIRQGKGSRIVATPLENGMVEIGGLVELDGVRPYPA